MLNTDSFNQIIKLYAIDRAALKALRNMTVKSKLTVECHKTLNDLAISVVRDNGTASGLVRSVSGNQLWTLNEG